MNCGIKFINEMNSFAELFNFVDIPVEFIVIKHFAASVLPSVGFGGIWQDWVPVHGPRSDPLADLVLSTALMGSYPIVVASCVGPSVIKTTYSATQSNLQYI